MNLRLKRNIIVVMVLTSFIISSLSFLTPWFVKKANADSNVATWVMCKTDDGQFLYNAATTDLVPYNIRSKSNLGKTQPIDGVLNSILSVSGYNHEEVNEAILGRPVFEDKKDDEDNEDGKETENKPSGNTANPNASAPKVSAFDRFGVAGLSFTSYMGEWKYYETDACSDLKNGNASGGSNNDSGGGATTPSKGQFAAQSPMPGVSYNFGSDFATVPQAQGGAGHSGMDISTGAGDGNQSVHAMADGVVYKVTDGCPYNTSTGSTCGGSMGNTVWVWSEGPYDGMMGPKDASAPASPRSSWEKKPDGGVMIIFMHLTQGKMKVKVGDKVKAGQPVGYMGSSGPSSGPHLHVSMLQGTKEWDYEKMIDPKPFIAPNSEPGSNVTGSGTAMSSAGDSWDNATNSASGGGAMGTNFGIFYEDRKEPKASFNEMSQSKDPRVIQYNTGIFKAWSSSFNDMLANTIFSLTKLIVTLTIALIGLSFVDITDLIGFGANNSGGGMIGMFNNLYSGFFQSLIIVILMFTAAYMMYHGLILKKYRQVLVNGLGQFIICFFLAAVIAAKPEFWLPLPNRIATYGQAVVINGLGQSTDSQSELCGTDVGSINSKNVKVNGTEAQQKKELAELGKNMKSTIGCRMWEELLLKPWTRGQFGDEYKNLNAKGTSGKQLKNINEEWVKSADVPLGGDFVAHNWALFQLSSQTEVHAQLSGETGTATDPTTNHIKLVDGISSDWWRTVDALSNYDEKEETLMFDGANAGVNSQVRVEADTLPQWQSWIGNRPSERYSVALLSVLFGTLGAIGPLVFGLLTTIYSAGITFLMATSPIFLLLGCWAGHGDMLFIGWLQGLLSTMIKKIVCSVLLLISFAFTMNAMDMVDEVGWIKSFALLLILTILLIKNRQFIFDSLSQVNLGSSFRPDKMIPTFMKKPKEVAKDMGDIGVGMVSGAHEASKLGISRADGAMAGMRIQALNSARHHQFTNYMAIEYNRQSGGTSDYCSLCGRNLEGRGFLDPETNDVYCYSCAIDQGLETEMIEINNGKNGGRRQKSLERTKRQVLKEINEQRLITRKTDTDVLIKHNKLAKSMNGKGFENKSQDKNKQSIYGTSNASWLSHTQAFKQANIYYDDDGKVNWDNEKVNDMISTNLVRLEQTIEEYEAQWNKFGEVAAPPSTPEPIEKYVKSSVLNEAWHAGRYDIVRQTYRDGWESWYEDNSMVINNITDTDKLSVNEVTRELDTEKIYEAIKDNPEFKDSKGKLNVSNAMNSDVLNGESKDSSSKESQPPTQTPKERLVVPPKRENGDNDDDDKPTRPQVDPNEPNSEKEIPNREVLNGNKDRNESKDITDSEPKEDKEINPSEKSPKRETPNVERTRNEVKDLTNLEPNTENPRSRESNNEVSDRELERNNEQVPKPKEIITDGNTELKPKGFRNRFKRKENPKEVDSNLKKGKKNPKKPIEAIDSKNTIGNNKSREESKEEVPKTPRTEREIPTTPRQDFTRNRQRDDFNPKD